MKQTEKTVSAVLLLLSLLTASSVVLSSCGDAETTPAETQAVKSETTAAVSEETETKAVADVPEKDYDGHTFTFLISGNIENNRQKNDFYTEGETGEVLNDAIYARNLTVEERFNIKLDTFEEYDSDNTGKGKGYKLLTKTIMAGDYSYDAAMLSGYDCATLAYSGYLLDMNAVPYVDLSKSWWDQKCNTDLSVSGKLYYTTGDISTADNDATCTILFNKALVAEHDMESPYTLVKEGKWTIDKMAAMCTDISSDLNGDGKYDENDRYGAIIWDDSMMAIVNACGNKCCTIDENGQIALTLNNERTVSMFDKFVESFYDKSVSYAYQRFSYDITTPINMFTNNQALFYMQLLDLVTYLRDMKTDFGIIPYPKLDEQQTEYYNTIGSWHSVFLCVPTAQEDTERTGIILESLAAESQNIVTPAYYEKTLVGKYIRDDESADMIDIILATRVYDLGWFYQIGGYNENIMNLWRQYKTDFSSMYEKFLTKAEKKMAEVNESFAALE